MKHRRWHMLDGTSFSKNQQKKCNGRYLNASGNGNDVKSPNPNIVTATGNSKSPDLEGSKRLRAVHPGFGGYILGDDGIAGLGRRGTRRRYGGKPFPNTI